MESIHESSGSLDDRSPGFDEPADEPVNALAVAAGLVRSPITNEGEAAKAWVEFTTLETAVKRRKAEIEKDLLEYMTGGAIKEINIGGGSDGKRYRIRATKKKKEIWDVKAVMDMFGIHEQVQAIFSSPKFRKGELTVALGDRKAVDEFIKVEWSDDVEIKEIDTEAVKRFAR